MRNWPQTLPNASFRGVPFFVEEDSFSDGGRRVATHDYVKSEVHDTEDMGRKTKKRRLRAYVASDTAEDDAAALEDACDQIGDGVLQTLFWGQITVKCTNCSGSGKRDELGRIWMDLEFVDSGSSTAVAVTAIGDRIAATALSGLGDLVYSALSAFTG